MELRRLKRKARHWFDRTVSVDLRGETDDVLEGFRIAKYRKFILDVPLENWRTKVPIGSVCTADTIDPLINTLWLHDEGKCDRYVGSPLQSYFESFQPQSMAEGVGLVDRSTCSAAWKTRPYQAVLPWRSINVLKKEPTSQQRRNRALQDILSRSGLESVGELSGKIYWGPVSQAFGEACFLRLTSLFRSIRMKGYRFPPPDQPFRVEILIRDGKGVIEPTSGKHRIVTIAANRLSSVPVYLGGKNSTFVRREQASDWPLVKAGFYTVDEAQAVFDRVFDGVPVWTPPR